MAFAYTVEEDDFDDDGIGVRPSTLTLSGGTIKDTADAANTARLFYKTVFDQIGHRVDGVVPALSSATVTGRMLRLVYHELLDTTSVPATSDFVVQVGYCSADGVRCGDLRHDGKADAGPGGVVRRYGDRELHGGGQCRSGMPQATTRWP